MTTSGVNIDDRHTSELLIYLQDIHDSIQPSDWPVALRKAAVVVGLTCNLLQTT